MPKLTHRHPIPPVETYEFKRLMTHWASSGAQFDSFEFKQIISHVTGELEKVAPTYIPHYLDGMVDVSKWARNPVEAAYRLVELAHGAYPGEIIHCAQLIREEREALAAGSPEAIAFVNDPFSHSCHLYLADDDLEADATLSPVQKHTVDKYTVSLGRRRIFVVNDRVFPSTTAASDLTALIARVLDGEVPPFNDGRPYWFDGPNVRQGEKRIIGTVDSHYHLAGADHAKAQLIARRLNGSPATVEESRDIAAKTHHLMKEAECMRAVRASLISAGIVDENVPDVFVADAVIAKFRQMTAVVSV